MNPRALVLRAPGINCDQETAQACRLAGFDTTLLHINYLLKDPNKLLDFHFLVIPGGFSYGDDLGAGTLLAKNLTIHLGQQLRQFVDEGRPVLGICNGFQVLVRAGLLPGELSREKQNASLTENASAQFECRWVTVIADPESSCLFTKGISQAIQLPVAHGEGQFVLTDPDQLASLQAQGLIALTYRNRSGREDQPVSYPANPNGSIGNVAGVCNAQGNVMGLMPHPERYVKALQHPGRLGLEDGSGYGLGIFQNACNYIKERLHLASGTQEKPQQELSYATSGVNIDASDHAKNLMMEAVKATQGPEVLAGMGAFAGMYSAQSLQQMQRPALVASTDGVGTKTVLAAQARRFDTVGFDLVNHSVNDLLTQGAKPLFFMDYLAMGKLDPVQAATIVRGVASACQEVGCALLGGETAEMPDVYLPSAFDLAGTIVGVIEQENVIDGRSIQEGDVLLGLPSSGLHTNGYSLARKIFAPYPDNITFPELGEPLIDVLLRPHRCYLHEIERLRQDAGIALKGMAHITGGGFEGNISRILPAGTRAVIETSAWRVPPIFKLIAELGRIQRKEMYRAFNMGVGMVIVVSATSVSQARQILPELLTVGTITSGNGVVLR